jgi:ESX secretion system ATPase EccB
MRQTDPAEWPNRRLGGAGFASAMVAIIALAAVGVYGMLVHGGKTSWQDGRTVIVVSETGASYVYIDGNLHPTLNFASAALLVGTTQVTKVSKASIAGVSRGVELGIEDAPTTLPTQQDLVTPPWSLCTQRVQDSTGTMVSRTRLVVSRGPRQGTAPGDAALLVTDSSAATAAGGGAAAGDLGGGASYLIWHDLRYQLTDFNVARVALRLDQEVNIPVGGAWLKALPAGQPIGPITVADSGHPSHAANDLTIGQVVKVDGVGQAGAQFYLAEAERLVPISELQALLQQATGASVVTLQPSAVVAAPKAAAPQSDATMPPSAVPRIVRPADVNTVLCAAYQNGSFNPRVLVDSAIPAGGGLPTAGTSTSGIPLADRVWVPPGKAAIVQALPSPEATSGPLSLVTDEGRRYAIPSSDLLRSLGFTGQRVSKLPASLLVRIPEGPALDPDQARAALQLQKTDS